MENQYCLPQLININHPIKIVKRPKIISQVSGGDLYHVLENATSEHVASFCGSLFPSSSLLSLILLPSFPPSHIHFSSSPSLQFLGSVNSYLLSIFL